MSGRVITFYSYKGGVGRSFALANIGTILSQWGYRTLVIDFDLEAPGLNHFFCETSIETLQVSSASSAMWPLVNQKLGIAMPLLQT